MAAEAAAAKYRDSMLIPAENAIGYTFHNYCLLLEALQAAGSSLQHIYPDGNKKLAMVGDAVMEVPLLEYLYTLNISRGMCHL
jgi:dsRNA-specific ribonuclease